MTANATTYTPYKAAQLVNAALEEAGLDKRIPPQMMYNYTTARVRKGKAPFIAVDENGRITEEGLTAWMTKYLEKQGVTIVTDEEMVVDEETEEVTEEA